MAARNIVQPSTPQINTFTLEKKQKSIFPSEKIASTRVVSQFADALPKSSNKRIRKYIFIEKKKKRNSERKSNDNIIDFSFANYAHIFIGT